MTTVAQEQRRRSLRLTGYDYRTPGAYFVTICCAGRELLFINPDFRRVADSCWGAIPTHFPNADLDAFVVMPNHVHGILLLQVEEDHAHRHRPFATGTVQPGSLSAMIRSYKAATTKEINILRGMKAAAVWQRNYYEHIVRDEQELQRIRDYIANNPANWNFDHENPNRDVSVEYLRAWSWIENP